MSDSTRETLKQLELLSPFPTGVGQIERGQCPLGARTPMSCMVCEFGHMLDCHYPLDCEEAQCSHYLQETETSEAPLAGWPCCACDETIKGDDRDSGPVLLDKLATWEDPSWGNVLDGSGGRASASLCGHCANEERPPQYAIKNEGEAHIRVPLDELEDIDQGTDDE